MTYNPTQFPANPIYFDPSFIDTGINRIQVHQIRARYYSNNTPLQREQGHWRQTLEQVLDQTVQIQLRKEAFPQWIPNQYQFGLLQRSRAYLSTIPRCEICALPKGIYCESPSIRATVPSLGSSTRPNQDPPSPRKNKKGRRYKFHHSSPQRHTTSN